MPVRHIVEFKENLQVLLIGVLFILLAGRVQIDNLLRVGWPALGFIVLLIGCLLYTSRARTTDYTDLKRRTSWSV